MTHGRIDTQSCVMCGNPLLYPFNEFRACTVCTEIMKKAQYEVKMHRHNKDRKKTILNVKRDPIFMATRPLGKDA